MYAKVNTTEGWTELSVHGCSDPIIKIYNDEFNSNMPFSKEMADEIAETIAEKVLSEYPRIIDKGDYVYVTDGKKLIEFYWNENDNWKYGIKTKKEAMKLAKHFIALYRMDELPTPKLGGITFKPNLGHVSVYLNGEKIATFRTMSSAKEFYSDYCDISRDINSNGLKSHSTKWDRSIRATSMSRGDITTYCLLLMEYMDTWGRCD